MQIQISWLLRSQLIWVYTVCKFCNGRAYPGSAGPWFLVVLLASDKYKTFISPQYIKFILSKLNEIHTVAYMKMYYLQWLPCKHCFLIFQISAHTGGRVSCIAVLCRSVIAFMSCLFNWSCDFRFITVVEQTKMKHVSKPHENIGCGYPLEAILLMSTTFAEK